jgi:hypothetical protein
MYCAATQRPIVGRQVRVDVGSLLMVAAG